MHYFFLSILLILGNNFINAQEDYCYGKDKDRRQFKNFATKTAYTIAHGTEGRSQLDVPGCKAVKIWILSRHGTRLPTAKTIEQLPELESLRDRIGQNTRPREVCPEDLYNIQIWKPNVNFTVEYSEYLTKEGWEDMRQLAKTYQIILPDILGKRYDENMYLFRHTNTQRTEASFKAFAEGLFESYNDIKLPPPPQKDYLLRPYDFCPQWKEQSKEKTGPGSELDKFDKSDIMQETIKNISSRLGFQNPLEPEHIQLMWDMCRYEQAYNREITGRKEITRSSVWCGAFTPKAVLVLEYREDIKYYYKAGHGLEINSRVSCEAVKDFLHHMESNQQPQAVAYFTHSASIQTFLTALGIAKDPSPLRSDNFDQMSKRKWRTSTLSPFGANIAVVKYECPNSETDKTKLIFMLNETPVEFSWCNVGLCDWIDVKRKFARFLNANCNDLFCIENNSGGRLHISLGLMILSLLMYLISY